MANITTRPLSNDEIVKLVARTKQPWKSVYFIAVFTGLRISDLVRLPWTPEPPTYGIPEKKTKKTKLITWTDVGLSYWAALYAWGRPRRFLFPSQDFSTYRKHIQADCRKLSITSQRVAFHSLRKSHAVIAYRGGGITAARIAMNHSSERTTVAYVEKALSVDLYSSYDSLFSPLGGHNDKH